MRTHTAILTSEPAPTALAHLAGPDRQERLASDVRAEFLELPRLSLTLAQAARLFDADLRHTKRVMNTLVGEGFLVRDARGTYRRRHVSAPGIAADARPHLPAAHVEGEPVAAHASPSTAALPEGDLLEALGVELPCLGCHRSYRVSLRSIRLSQMMMDAGCQVRHFADCRPAGFANLVDPALLVELERVVERIELAADGAGGRLAFSGRAPRGSATNG